MDNEEIAEALFAALAANDAAAVRGLCAPDLQVVQNGAAPVSLEKLLKFNAAVHKVVAGFGYSDAVRSATATGFVEEHAACGTLAGGAALRLPVCVVADVKGGQVTSVREYFDSAAAAPLVAALSRPG